MYQVIQRVDEINKMRKMEAPNHRFTCSSYDDIALKKNKDLELTYIVAPPRMKYYMKYSTAIYNIYLKWFSAEDIYVYSIDEVFIDITNYLQTYHMTPRELITRVIKNVYDETGITATGGIGTNMYLCKVAMDIVAKHITADKYGVRVAGLDEITYRKFLWSHRPLTDFWRVGNGIAKKLEQNGMFTMGDVAKKSVTNEELLYNLFGINAELLIDHAWGYEPCTIKSVKEYKPVTNSISKNLITSKLVLTIGYDVENLKDPEISKGYLGEITLDHYGRKVPKHSHGTINLDHKTSSTKIITKAVLELYEKIINKNLLVRRINVSAENVVDENDYNNIKKYEQVNLFTDYSKIEKEKQKEKEEKALQKAVISIKEKFGKNSIIKGMNLEKAGTTIERNTQIGGHKE